jgi:hypothetical protein
MRWTAVAVLVSALWLIGVFGHVLWDRAEKNTVYAATVYGSCMVLEDRRIREQSPPTSNYRQCEEDRAEALAEANKGPIDWRPLAMFGLPPLPFLWLGIFLFGWIRGRVVPR